MPTERDSGGGDEGASTSDAGSRGTDHDPDAGDGDAGDVTDAGDADAGDAGDAGDADAGNVPGTCRVYTSGGTGGEPGGQIPSCCTPSVAQKAQTDELLALLNAYRAENGLDPLTEDPKLTEAIQGHCEHMVLHDFFDHRAPEGLTYPIRASICGTTAHTENLAMGQQTPAQVMQSWKASTLGHNENMLRASVTRVGVGNAARYWGLLFGE